MKYKCYDHLFVAAEEYAFRIEYLKDKKQKCLDVGFIVDSRISIMLQKKRVAGEVQ